MHQMSSVHWTCMSLIHILPNNLQLSLKKYAVVHGQKVLRANIAYLKLALSDQNLELIPDYEQRIGVLKDLKFIDENSTIQLKGRVACEVYIFPD